MKAIWKWLENEAKFIFARISAFKDTNPRDVDNEKQMSCRRISKMIKILIV